MADQMMPEKFPSIMIDFIEDLNTTFPEYKSLWWVYSKDTTPDGWKDLYQYCLTVYPERFFDILYQNEELFSDESTHNTNFLPNVEFKRLFRCEGVSDSTKNSLWKYLQLILFTVISNVQNKNEFGETMNMFEGIDEEELQNKLAEAMEGLGDFFQNVNEQASTGQSNLDEDSKKKMDEFFQSMEEEMKQSTSDENGPTEGQMPNADDLHNHLKGLFGGKLGSLAKELMEELGGDLEDTLGINSSDFGENAAPTDILKKLMRNPDKIMKLVQKVQGKFQQKMNSGDLSQEDLMKEAGDMLRKMKEMGGNSKQMHEMFQNLAKNMGGMGGSSKNMRMDTGKLDRMMKSQETRERMRAKLEKRKQEATAAQNALAESYALESQGNNNLVYRPVGGEKAEKTKLSDAQIADLTKEFEGAITTAADKSSSNKKKNKKKKAKKT